MIFFSKGTCNRGTQNGGMDDGRSIRYIIKERFIDGKDAAFRRSAAPTPTGKSIHIGQGLPAFFHTFKNHIPAVIQLVAHFFKGLEFRYIMLDIFRIDFLFSFEHGHFCRRRTRIDDKDFIVFHNSISSFSRDYFIRSGYRMPSQMTMSAPPIRVEMDAKARRFMRFAAVRTAISPLPPMLQQQRPAVTPHS